MKKISLAILIILIPSVLISQFRVKTINFLDKFNLEYNAAGPMLVTADETNNKIYIANTLSSAVTIIDGKTDKVINIPVGGRTLQHLKSTAITYNSKTGIVYIIGTKNFFIVDPKTKRSQTIDTEKQFECITVENKSGNVFLAGRESSELGFYNAKTKKFELIEWLEHKESLTNLNQTPPPAIRIVYAINDYKRTILAVDGYSSTLYLIAAENAKIIQTRKIPLGNNDGRWHLAGYDGKTKHLIIATETKTRKITDIAKIDAFGNDDIVVKLPEGFSEPVGIIFNTKLQEAYIPYDNHAFIHVVEFNNGGTIDTIPIPAYGNDGSAIDTYNNILYIASWAHGEVEVIDLKKRKFIKKISGLGIIPHMFTFTFNKANGYLYFPVGASAVNGTFGASVTKLDPKTEATVTIHTGWAPIELIDAPYRSSVFVFNNEDQFAEVQYGGSRKYYPLPVRFPVCASRSPEGNIYLSYGPHQSYWPTVYIWGARNGVLTINKDNLEFYDRRIPRQAMQMESDKNGILYLQQNNWGKEPIIINKIEDDVRNYEIGKRITLEDSVQRETTQRVMKYDEKEHLLYLLRLAEKDEDPSVLYIINPDSNKSIKRVEVGLNATDLEFDDNNIYTANFGSNSVSIINKKTFKVINLRVGKAPLRLCRCSGKVFVMNYETNDIMEVKIPDVNESTHGFKIPPKGNPDNLYCWNEKLVITKFDNDYIYIIEFDPKTKKFELIYKRDYSYGETSFDTGNAAFYVNGIFGDILFSLTKGITDSNGNFWLTDFLAGKLYIIGKK
ncbi:YncE family protein [Bacteroidota bacterium]